ncbi:spore coat protein, CotS family [Hathewaya proteolytica DSM 3090]|uniref:Spore coat protein, CotS family n=1 Tax=Hathewaya proteolytica DSM 3090 TaxID=1121331 RepID=A0A1M6PGC6_9CLOT|nr:CotS family spore coat protein [Hathewaya proteolytica]SHK07008.1 spore coat protein, CotS family [Hathewaya proteolytica DSM 3090]
MHKVSEEVFQKVKNIVEEKYEIPVETMEKIKNVYKIFASDGSIYSLKPVKYEKPHFNFIFGVMKHLQNQGYKGVPKFITTSKGEEYINFFDKWAYMNPWIMGRESNYNNIIDVNMAALNLANMHDKARNFKVQENMKPRNYVGKWVDNFSTRKHEILDFKNRICAKDKKSQFDGEYMEIMLDELNRCDLCIEHLKEHGYFKYMDRQKAFMEFCHHDYANHNVLIDGNNQTFLIDFDYCILDTHIHDVASLLIRVMKDGKWSLSTAKNIMSIYKDKIDITNEEVLLIADFMEFPQAYWQLGIQYYWEKQPWGEEFFLKKLNRIAVDREERQEFIEELRGSLR